MKRYLFLPVFLLFLLAKAQETPELVLPIGHTSWISTGSFSPDGKLLVTASGDNTSKIWDAATGKLLYTLNGDYTMVRSAVFSLDGKTILTVASDNLAKISDAKTGKTIYNLEGHTASVRSAKYSSDGKTIITASFDSTAKIWDATTCKLLYTLTGHKDRLSTAEFSRDGKMILTASKDGNVKIWDTENRKAIHDLYTNILSGVPFSLATFSPDGTTIVTALQDSIAKIWDIKTGKVQYNLTGHAMDIYSVAYSADGKSLVTASRDSTAKIWNVANGKLLYNLAGHSARVMSAVFSPDGTSVLTASMDKTAKIWDAANGKLLHNLTGHTYFLENAIYSPDGKLAVTMSDDNTAKMWDVKSGKLLQSFEGRAPGIGGVCFSPDHQTVLTALANNTAKISDLKNGKTVHTFKAASKIYSAAFTQDGKKVIGTCADSAVRVWDVESEKLLYILHDTLIYNTAAFNQDFKVIITSSFMGKTKIWNAETGQFGYAVFDSGAFNENTRTFVAAAESLINQDGKTFITFSGGTVKIRDTKNGRIIRTLTIDAEKALRVIYSPDKKTIVVTSDENSATLWSADSGKLLQTLEGHTNRVIGVAFSPDSKTIVTTGDKTAKLWNAETGRLLYTLTGHTANVWYAYFNPSGEIILTASGNGEIKIWESKTGHLIKAIDGKGVLREVDWDNNRLLTNKSSQIHLIDLNTGSELLSWLTIDSVDWVVLHPSGLFDASPGAMKIMYYVQGLNVIEFDQLKDRYYEPGLWKQVMEGQKLRDVRGLNEMLKLYPEINMVEIDADGQLNIGVKNNGGGIGKVKIFVNDKEITADARGGAVSTYSDSISVTYPIQKHPYLLPDGENTIEVKAYNADNSLISRGTKVIYASKTPKSNEAPNLFILSCGVSDYEGISIDLKFAAKDAENITQALEIGAKRLFGTEKTFTYLLTTNNPDSTKQPTKENIEKAFEQIARQAKSTDVIVVYLSGHGINWGGAEGDFYYLTKDAYSASGTAYTDSAIRKKTTLSSKELMELVFKVPALKEVLIIDACASGKMVDNLMVQRDIEPSTIRALEKLKDRTGMHIITGCAADAVSFEASKYGQGVLTYSLIEGIKGAALQEDQFVDVRKLFDYAQNRVPQLASGIGGIQQPKAFSPYGVPSFPIGELNENDKKLVPLAKSKPMFIRSSFIGMESKKDNLGLTKSVNEILINNALKDYNSQWVYVDVADFPEAYQLSGLYKQIGTTYRLEMTISSSSKNFEYVIKSPGKEELIKEITEVLNKNIRQF